MKKSCMRSAAAAVLIVMLVSAAPVCAEMLCVEPERARHASAGEIIGDFFILRPIMLTGTIIGTGIFIVTSPFTLIGNNIGRSAEVLVVNPAKYTFAYPLGSY